MQKLSNFIVDTRLPISHPGKDVNLLQKGGMETQLQYVHCRLFSLEENCGVHCDLSNPQACLSYLTEIQAFNIVREIARLVFLILFHLSISNKLK